MRQISAEQVLERLRAENPWWKTGGIGTDIGRWSARPYLDLFFPLVQETEPHRAVVLLGPRRVGKTVLLHHTIERLLANGVPAGNLCYVSVDHPIYNGLSLDNLIAFAREAAPQPTSSAQRFIFFDEIQYLRDWEVHLKSAVDDHRSLKLVASGSAAAALRLKSQESGAGRFTDFLLPPLTFFEYLTLLGRSDLVQPPSVSGAEADMDDFCQTSDIHELNREFVRYLNFGGYPEVVFSERIQADPVRFIKADIIDKVLLRDLPQLYGIRDIQELNYLFTTLAFNTAGEVSLEELSKNSGVAKNTIKRYIEYLEAAFLIKTIHRVDRSSRRFRRANYFKVYLTNPSMRAALFSPIDSEDDSMGALAETAIFSQWFHSDMQNLYYARWHGGEVDLVSVNELQKASWAVEIKWTDRYARRPRELKSLISFCRTNGVQEAIVTTETVEGQIEVDGLQINFVPASIYCATVGFNVVRSQQMLSAFTRSRRAKTAPDR